VAVENRALPEYHYLIIDEAHHLEDSTTRQLTLHLNEALIGELVEELGVRLNQRRPFGLLAEIAVRTKTGLPKSIRQEIEPYLDHIRSEAESILLSSRAFFDALNNYLVEHNEDQARPTTFPSRRANCARKWTTCALA